MTGQMTVLITRDHACVTTFSWRHRCVDQTALIERTLQPCAKQDAPSHISGIFFQISMLPPSFYPLGFSGRKLCKGRSGLILHVNTADEFHRRYTPCYSPRAVTQFFSASRLSTWTTTENTVTTKLTENVWMYSSVSFCEYTKVVY